MLEAFLVGAGQYCHVDCITIARTLLSLVGIPFDEKERLSLVSSILADV